MIRLVLVIAAAACVSLLQPTASLQPYVVENLGRGLVALRTGDTSVYVGWRLLGTDPSDIAFNVYRAASCVPNDLERLPAASTRLWWRGRMPPGTP